MVIKFIGYAYFDGAAIYAWTLQIEYDRREKKGNLKGRKKQRTGRKELMRPFSRIIWILCCIKTAEIRSNISIVKYVIHKQIYIHCMCVLCCDWSALSFEDCIFFFISSSGACDKCSHFSGLLWSYASWAHIDVRLFMRIYHIYKYIRILQWISFSYSSA